MRFLATLALTLLPVPALALSCLPPDPAGLFIEARDSVKAYTPVYGSFSASELAALPLRQDGSYDENAAPHEDYPGLRFTGKALTPQGFTANFSERITLRLSCLGPWCTGKPAPGPMIAYLEWTGGRHVLDLNACGGMAMQHPDRQALHDTAICYQGGPCSPSSY